MGKKLGIDLGTTYSCVSYVDEVGHIQLVPSRDGGTTTASLVYIADGSVLVGLAARQEGAAHPEGTYIERIKNFMNSTDYTIHSDGVEYSPAAISGIILRQLIEDASTALQGEEIESVVITCPAYFGDVGRTATKCAAEQEGLKVQAILDEPVAAALAYTYSKNVTTHKNIMVYDLGGGTFDVAIVKVDIDDVNKSMEIITTEGNHQLGGKDWDDVLATYFITEFCVLTGANPIAMKNDPELRVDFSERIERAKIALTNRPSTSIMISYGGDRQQITITREKFDELTQSQLGQTLTLINNMFTNKQMTINDVDEILLVGGSTRMPQVAEMIQREFPNTPMFQYRQDTAVAEGAALIASGIAVYIRETNTTNTGTTTTDDSGMCVGGTTQSTTPSSIGVIPKCSKSYGLIAYDEKTNSEIIANIIMKNTLKPAKQERLFGTQIYDQRSVILKVYENDKEADDVAVEAGNQIYENCEVPLMPGLPEDAPVKVIFEIDQNGILTVDVIDVTRGTSSGTQYLKKLGNSSTGTEAAQKLRLQ